MMQAPSKKNNNNCIKIKTFKYMSNEPSRKLKSRSYENNPIRIVVDKMGQDGQYHRQIVNQLQEQERQQMQNYSSKVLQNAKEKKQDYNIYNYYSQNSRSNPKQGMINSEVFNRFQYNNSQKVPIKSNRKLYKISPNKINYHSQKNLEIVFCQTKFPEFVNKTNNKIQEIFKKEQNNLHLQNQKFILSSLSRDIPSKTIRKTSKTTLSNCLKQFGILEKLSNFMENDRNLRQNCLCYGLQKDPSKTLLLDVLTHRFTFMKKLGRRLRQQIYRLILGREYINILTKINIQQYMRFYEMFIGRDSSTLQIATFVYLLLFGTSLPTLQLAKPIIQQTNGPLHKQRLVLEQLKQVLQQQSTQIMPLLCNNVKLLHNFIDLLVQK